MYHGQRVLHAVLDRLGHIEMDGTRVVSLLPRRLHGFVLLLHV